MSSISLDNHLWHVYGDLSPESWTPLKHKVENGLGIPSGYKYERIYDTTIDSHTVIKDGEYISIVVINFDFPVRYCNDTAECNDYELQISMQFQGIPIRSLPYKTQHEYKFSDGVYSDPIYSSIERGNFESYFNAFKADAKRHGVDLSHITKHDFNYLRDLGHAALASVCSKPSISYDRRTWIREQSAEVISEYIPWNTLKILWHEFGHSILKLGHTCESYHIMNNKTQVLGTSEACSSDTITGLYRLHWDHPDPNYNWQRAVKDMFSGAGQVYPDCSAGSRSYNTCNHSHIQDED